MCRNCCVGKLLRPVRPVERGSGLKMPGSGSLAGIWTPLPLSTGCTRSSNQPSHATRETCLLGPTAVLAGCCGPCSPWNVAVIWRCLPWHLCGRGSTPLSTGCTCHSGPSSHRPRQAVACMHGAAAAPCAASGMRHGLKTPVTEAPRQVPWGQSTLYWLHMPQRTHQHPYVTASGYQAWPCCCSGRLLQPVQPGECSDGLQNACQSSSLAGVRGPTPHCTGHTCGSEWPSRARDRM